MPNSPHGNYYNEDGTRHTPKESARAKQAYADYVAMGEKRSIPKLHEHYLRLIENGFEVPTRGIDRLKHWCMYFKWRDRIERIAMESVKSAEQEQAERQQVRREEYADKVLETCEALLEKAQLMLKFPLSREHRTVDGQQVIVEPAKWTFDTPARLIETATKLYNLAEAMRSGKNEVNLKEMVEFMAAEMGLAPDMTGEAVTFAEGYLKAIQDKGGVIGDGSTGSSR